MTAVEFIDEDDPMTYQGIVQNGVVVFENGAALPDGARVSVVLIAPVDEPTAMPSTDPVQSGLADAAKSEDSIWRKLTELAKKHADRPTNLPPDLAINHDHYLHGTAKRQ